MDRAALLYEREELMKSLLDVEDVGLIKKLRSMLKRETAKRPAVMTVDELKAEVMEGVRQVENGEVVSHEDLFAEFGL